MIGIRKKSSIWFRQEGRVGGKGLYTLLDYNIHPAGGIFSAQGKHYNKQGKTRETKNYCKDNFYFKKLGILFPK